MGAIIQIIFDLLKKGFKYGLLLGVIGFMLFYFNDYIIFALYHLNLSLYLSLGYYLSNGTLILLTILIVIIGLVFIYKKIKSFL